MSLSIESMLIRPVVMSDLDAVLALANCAKTGLTTLPQDKALLAQRIELSIASFRQNITKPGPEEYFFVLENIKTGQIIGCCAIWAKTGGYKPFYTYDLKTLTRQSHTLGITKQYQILQLSRIHDGPSEIGSLFMLPDVRTSGLGRLLSLHRFLFMNMHKARFEDRVIAEMRGYFDQEQQSPFWNDVARHFFPLEFKKADTMSLIDKTFIEDLVPQHPIYISLLPEAVQTVIGKVHPDTEPALRLLQSEGFEFRHQVDIFEAGPIYGVAIDQIRCVRQSSPRLVSFGASQTNNTSDDLYLIAFTSQPENYRCVMAALEQSENQIKISDKYQDVLGCQSGDAVIMTPIR